jgi:uncharacterized membrane protein YdbT with pleckstrin-like domain
MSYVQSVLVPGESVIAQAKTHWCVYGWALLFLVAGVILLILLPPIGVVLLLMSMYLFVKAFIYVKSTELAVTSKRVIAKFGFIRRNTVELSHSKVESFHVNQGILGRIFNYGSIVVTGSGGTNAPIPYIADPLKFRSNALVAIEPKGS